MNVLLYKENIPVTTPGTFLQMKERIKKSKILHPQCPDITELHLPSKLEALK
jgi:hypothetical protein